MTPRTVALVESATQLLNVAEWAYAEAQTDGLRIDVLAPRDRHTVRQIARVADLVTGLDVEIRVHPVRRPAVAAVLGAARALGDIARAPQLVIGDPFSRFIQTLLPSARAEHVVVVDDGTATWEFAACIRAAKPLVRWQVPLSGAERRATRATRLLSPSRSRALTVFSCLQEVTPIGAAGVPNHYAWARSLARPEIVDDEVDVLGVSLVDTGVVERRAYLDAVARLARRDAPVRYVAHRRESESLATEIATIPGVRVTRADLPVELAFRLGPVARKVITFPSTAAHTLPVVLGDLDVDIEVRRVEPAWFTARTTSHARDFVARIADDAPLPPVLEIA
jgi:hypothetical protein